MCVCGVCFDSLIHDQYKTCCGTKALARHNHLVNFSKSPSSFPPDAISQICRNQNSKLLNKNSVALCVNIDCSLDVTMVGKQKEVPLVLSL